jgi:DNA-binding transcriptional LysR family regulator
MSHSAVSRHLTDLETSLGTVLFTRSREGLLATSMAEQIVERAERVEAEVQGLERQAANQETVVSGEVRVTSPPLLSQHLIMPHLAAFAREYPEIEISLQSTYAIDDLMKGAADVALRSQFNPNDNLVGRRLPDFVERAYASPEYIQAHWFEDNQTDAQWIGRGLVDPNPKWVNEGPYPDAEVRHKFPDLADQALAAVGGLGMASLPCILGDTTPGLVRVPNTGVLSSRPVWVLTHPDLRTSVRIRTFTRFLVAAIQSQEALITGTQIP